MGKSHSRIDPCAQFAASRAIVDPNSADNATSPLQVRDHYHDCRGYVEQQAHHPDTNTQDAHRKRIAKESKDVARKKKRGVSRARRRRGPLQQQSVDAADASDDGDGGAGARGSIAGTTLGLSALGGVGAMGGVDTLVMLDSTSATLAPSGALWLSALCLVAVLLGIYVHMAWRRAVMRPKRRWEGRGAAEGLEVMVVEKETLSALSDVDAEAGVEAAEGGQEGRARYE